MFKCQLPDFPLAPPCSRLKAWPSEEGEQAGRWKRQAQALGDLRAAGRAVAQPHSGAPQAEAWGPEHGWMMPTDRWPEAPAAEPWPSSH